MRRAPQLGQKPLRLQLNATKCSWRQPAAEDYSERKGLAAEKRIEAFIVALSYLINQHVDPPADTALESDCRAQLMERRRKLWGLDEEESQLN